MLCVTMHDPESKKTLQIRHLPKLKYLYYDRRCMIEFKSGLTKKIEVTKIGHRH